MAYTKQSKINQQYIKMHGNIKSIKILKLKHNSKGNVQLMISYGD